MARKILGVVLSLVGAIIGGTLGVVIFLWCLRQGLYAMVIPGAALGLGVHAASLSRSSSRGYLAAIAALLLGLWAEATYFPFVADESLGYFMKNIARVLPIHLLMIAIGAFFGFWWGKQSSPWASKMIGKPL